MRILWLLLLLCIVGAVYHYKHAHHDDSGAYGNSAYDGDAYDSDASAHHGFVEMPKVIGFDESTVMIVAAENCPHADAQRADRLAEQLRDRGIPVRRAHQVDFDPNHFNPAFMKRVPAIMEGVLPIVFIHGRAKGNPTLDEVAAEYQEPRE